MYKYTHFIPENIAPTGAKKIGVYSKSGNKITEIPLGHLTPPKANKQYSFGAFSDVHIQYNTANEDFQRALALVNNSDCLFTCICGDLTEWGTDAQMQEYRIAVNNYANKPVYAITGNHDATNPVTSEWISQYTGKPLYYSFTQGNDVFVMVGNYDCYDSGWTAGNQFTDEELQWLYETLETNRNKRCFVFQHIFPWGGAGNANNGYNTNMWTSTRGTVFENLMKHYKNVVVFHGHSHFILELQESDERANYTADVGYRSVHIPSLAVPRKSDMTVLYAESQGYIVDVYDDFIVLNGRDFIDNDADGHIIPLATYKIDTKLVEVPANTFTDSTGTITTNQQ